MIVSPLLATALDDALRAAAATDGLCDPTIAAALESAGYDRTFAEIEPGPLGPAVPAGRWREIHLAGLLVRRPAGLRLDLNGVVKGRAVDDALALLEGDGFVSAGGDLATRGELVVALPAGDTVTLRLGRARDERHHDALLGSRRRRPRAPPDRSRHRRSRPTCAGSASPCAPRHASQLTSPPRRRSCSATTGRPGSSTRACRAGSSPRPRSSSRAAGRESSETPVCIS